MNIKIALYCLRILLLLIVASILLILVFDYQALAIEIGTTTYPIPSNLECEQFGLYNNCSVSIYNQAIPTFFLVLSGVLCGLFIWNIKSWLLNIFIILVKIILSILLLIIGLSLLAAIVGAIASSV